VFLTHFHSDHTSGVPDLWLTGWIQRCYGNRQNPFRIIGPTGTISFMQNLPSATYRSIPSVTFSRWNRTRSLRTARPKGYRLLCLDQPEDGESSGERIGGDTRGENSHAGFESAGAARLRWSQSRRLGAALSRTGKRDVDRSEKPLANSFARAIPYSRSSPSEPLFGTQTVIVMNSPGPSSSAQIVTWRLLRLDVPT